MKKPARKKEPQHGPSQKKTDIFLSILLVFFGSMVGFSGWKLYSSQQEYKVGKDAYASLASAVVQISSQSQETVSMVSQSSVAAVEEDVKAPVINIDFDALTAINSHTVGWISSDNGMIDYPVMHGEDNDYYLNHMPDGTPNKNGSIFVDYRNTPGFVDRNTFIYGHNMKNSTMFAELVEYGTEGYYEQHPELLLITPEGNYSLQVFSGYVTAGTSDIYKLTFRDDEDFSEYLERIRALSDFTSDVTVTAEDRIVTLSTCTYDYEDARYVVHCKLVPMQ